MVNDGTILKNQ